MNGQTGSRGDPADYQEDLDVRFAIAPIYGERGFPSGLRRARRPAEPRRPDAEREPDRSGDARAERRRRRRRTAAAAVAAAAAAAATPPAAEAAATR